MPAFAVALTRRRGPADPLLPSLAQHCGLAVFDLRTRLAVPDPALLLVTPDRDVALATLQCLRDAGHGAVACDLDYVVASEEMHLVREPRVTERALVDVGDGVAFPFEELILAVEAIHTDADEVSMVSTTRPIDDEGGVEIARSFSGAYGHERLLYLFRRDGTNPWIVGETASRFGHLGVPLRTRHEGFRALVSMLVDAGVAHDDRLARTKRPRRCLDAGRAFAATDGVVRVTEHAGRRTASSNRGTTDVAAHLLALAVRSGQA